MVSNISPDESLVQVTQETGVLVVACVLPSSALVRDIKIFLRDFLGILWEPASRGHGLLSLSCRPPRTPRPPVPGGTDGEVGDVIERPSRGGLRPRA